MSAESSESKGAGRQSMTSSPKRPRDLKQLADKIEADLSPRPNLFSP
jgi:hypothetical protein